jgi:hypothetical protein
MVTEGFYDTAVNEAVESALRKSLPMQTPVAYQRRCAECPCVTTMTQPVLQNAKRDLVKKRPAVTRMNEASNDCPDDQEKSRNNNAAIREHVDLREVEVG